MNKKKDLSLFPDDPTGIITLLTACNQLHNVHNAFRIFSAWMERTENKDEKILDDVRAIAVEEATAGRLPKVNNVQIVMATLLIDDRDAICALGLSKVMAMLECFSPLDNF